MKEIEIKYISRRFEELRLKDSYRERQLYTSIAEEGIRDPVQGVIQPQGKIILVDGYKRLRCLLKLGNNKVPFVSIGNSETEGLLNLVRLSDMNKLSTLEESVIIDELNQKHGLTVSDIAIYLKRSKSWVSVRLGIIGEMSETVKESLLKGDFPTRSYMYTLRQFTRVNHIPRSESDEFVKALSGKRYSTRDIELLAYGYFRGGKDLKEQILTGNLDWTLNKMKRANRESLSGSRSLNETERNIIRDLELVQKYMSRVNVGLANEKLISKMFFSNACLLIEGILSVIDNFRNAIREFYDRKKHTANRTDAL